MEQDGECISNTFVEEISSISICKKIDLQNLEKALEKHTHAKKEN